MQAVKSYAHPDGKRRIKFSRRTDGLYSFEAEELELMIEPDAEYFPEGEAYWNVTHVSGLFESLASAEAEAKANIAWLRVGSCLQSI